MTKEELKYLANEVVERWEYLFPHPLAKSHEEAYKKARWLVGKLENKVFEEMSKVRGKEFPYPYLRGKILKKEQFSKKIQTEEEQVAADMEDLKEYLDANEQGDGQRATDTTAAQESGRGEILQIWVQTA